MTSRNPSSSYKLWGSVMMFYRQRILLLSSSGKSNDMCSPSSMLVSGSYGTASPGLRSLCSNTESSCQNLNELNNRISSKEGGPTPDVPPLAPPATSKFNLLNWVKCLIGSVLSILVPFWRWENLQRLEGEVEKVVEEVEEVVEVVEKVAIMTEKASAVVAEILPQNCGVKDVCETVVKDAEQTKRFINKVGDLKQDLECLEKMVEPVIHKIEEMEHIRKVIVQSITLYCNFVHL